MAKARRGADTKREVKELLQNSLPEIFTIALDLAKDPKVAPSARAKLLGDLFRAGGLYDEQDDGRTKEHFEMTLEELNQEIENLYRQRDNPTGDIFE